MRCAVNSAKTNSARATRPGLFFTFFMAESTKILMNFAGQLGQGQNETCNFFGQLGHKKLNFFSYLSCSMCCCIIKMTEKCNTLQIHIFIHPYMDTSKQYTMCCLGECLGEWAERSDSLSESPCSLTRVGRQQYTGGLTNTAKVNATVSNGCTPYKKCSCPYELFEQRTHMVSWFHLMSLVIFHLISVEAGYHVTWCSLFEKLIWT